MIINPQSDMLIRIKNGYCARLKEISLPYSKAKEALANFLVKENYLQGAKVEDKTLKLELKYKGRKPVLEDIRIISKPSLKIYIPSSKIRKVRGGLGIAVISTSKGLMKGDDAYLQKVGGEFICEIW